MIFILYFSYLVILPIIIRNWQAEQRATQAERPAQLLAEQLRNLGIDPDTII
ncbi:hypothetical protein [Floridanema evergladense]|uniref:Uncharacterized protein n=1 Tax=Floridaenema evergladense BLCC-F167 TaxID=3153639 RepID=A0ABV4WQ91_9CYAN